MSNIHSRTKQYVWLGCLAAFYLAGARAGTVFPIATNPAIPEMAGGAAFDGTNYVVGLVSGSEVVCQRISGSGELVGSEIAVGGNVGFPPAVSMAAARTNGLVVWSDATLGSGVTIFGQLLSISGGKIGSSFPILANAAGHGTQAVQAAASDGTNFLVVWKDSASGSYYGQLVGASGSLSGAEFYLFGQQSGSGGGNMALVYGKTNYLAAWQNSTYNGIESYCQVISPSGAAGSPVQVNETASLDGNPMAAGFDGTNFLVVWGCDTERADSGQPLWKLRGRVVSPGGNPLGNELLLVDEQAAFPALAFDGENYLLAWGYDVDTTNSDLTIHARFLDRAGTALGPILTPFSAQGTNPPLLPLNGVLFDGDRYLLTATFGSFQLDSSGDIIGFSGGDVYGRFIPRSTRPPFFTSAEVSNGQFLGQLRVVPGMTYTVEFSTNLADWTPAEVVSSDATNLLALVDPRGVAGSSRMFYRAVLGNGMPAEYHLNFMEFADGGNFGAGLTPSLATPIALAGYSAWFGVEGDTSYPAPANVFFTGPAGSGLSFASADPSNSYVGASDAGYQSASIASPAAAPGGDWVVNYKGSGITFTLPDPQAASRLVIPLPTVSVSGDVLQSVSWTFHDPNTGALLPAAPSYVTGVQVEIDADVRIYNSPTISPDTTALTLTSAVNWPSVTGLNMTYDDSLGNHYVIFYHRP